MMKRSDHVCLCVISYLIFAPTILAFTSHWSGSSPLFAAFEHFKEITKDGCNIDVLPDNIDWCDGKLSRQGTLPENSVCQSLSTEDILFLACRNGRWVSHAQVSSTSDRKRKSIDQVYQTVKNTTCSRFCVDDETEFVGKLMPQFSSCPSSINLYPTGNQTDVHYTWDFPNATDLDGDIASIVQIVGPEPNSTFEGSSSPGISHVISYLATDNDNMNWTCSFVINSEIPACPPIIHITDGNTSCTDYNNRDSECTFICNHGYQLNGTSNATCLDNGNWSYGEDIPQCIAMTCSLPVLSTNDSSVLEVVCDNTTDGNVTFTDEYSYGSICWLQCPNDYLLKNDILQEDILQQLSSVLDDVTNARNDATVASQDANNAADDALVLAIDLQDSASIAENNSIVIEGNLDMANTELEELIKQFNATKSEMDQKLLELDDDTLDTPSIQALNKEINSLNMTLININASIQELLMNVDVLTIQLAEAQNTAETARENSNQAWIVADETEAIAAEKEVLMQEAVDAYAAGLQAFYDAQLYGNSGGSFVSTYALCTANGTWMILGNPYCEDIDPPGIKCLPVVTHYLNPGETSAVVTWDFPEVSDNSGNYILNISGPQPNDTLSRGQYVAEYRAADSAGNLSPLCQVVINVLVKECEDIAGAIDKEYMEAACDSFEVGTTCNLTCKNSYQLDGPSTVTCKLNSSTDMMYWDLGESYCIIETCAVPEPPTNGYMECLEDEPIDIDNTTDNSTVDGNTGIQCVAMCNNGSMLPYKTSSAYSCDEENGWDSEDFPSKCIESGGEKYTEYKYYLKHSIEQQSNCTAYDLERFVDDLAVILATEMTGYPACMNWYMCELGDMSGECSGFHDTVTVAFTVQVTCDGPITSIPDEAKCDLYKDGSKSFAVSLNESVEVNGVLDDLGVTLVDDWLITLPTVTPTCSAGAFLVGSYCARCAAGTFYDAKTDQCFQCGVGAYTNTNGRISCTTCSEGTSTLQKGSTECIETCKPGTYSSTGLEPCATCIPGTYQPAEEATTCVTCPVNTWTTGEGSDSEADCIEYDLYFSGDLDLYLASVNDSMSAVFWMKYYYPTRVGFELLYDNGDSAFLLDITDKPQLLSDNWDNQPLDVAMETDTWIMFGIGWETSSNRVTVYKDGELQLDITLSEYGQTDQLKLSVEKKTLFSGLSISSSEVGDAEMMSLYDDCGATLPDAWYTLDNLANTQHPAIEFAQSTCKSSPSDSLLDPCGIHECQYYSACVPNNDTAGYTCACAEEYGGNFCEETLVHGNWSEWFNAAECSTTCGPGTRLRYRLCNNPARSQYGNDCEGNSTEIIDCYMANCTECEPPETEGVTLCELEDDSCTAACPPGYVLPRGQEKQTFQCGMSTNYGWTPLHRLPICTESRQPEKYTGRLTFTFVDSVPCDMVNDVTVLMRGVASNQQCLTDLPTCNVSIEILDCSPQGNRRKRQAESQLVITYVVPLNSNVTFDLVEYYSTSVMTESILEAVTAIFVLEQTIQDILDDPGIFTADIDGVTFTVVQGSVSVETSTHCYPGEVPVEGVCAQCQKGTYEVNGWCVYCDRGSYQNLPGKSSCYACPKSQMTNYLGARDSVECIVIPEPPIEPDYTIYIVVAVCLLLAIVVILLVILLSRRFYLGAKDREKFDLEADRVSLYTDFPDISYNIFFKRKEVLGFDEEGHPIVGKTRFKNDPGKTSYTNGPVARPDEDTASIDDGRMSVVSKEPFAYPEDGQEPPFTYDPYAMWTEEAFVDPYEYPEMDAFDFPKIHHAVRYRVPGRKHMQNSYPLTQFGYTDTVYGSHRKNLQIPVTIPIPKKLPQLMYRKPDSMSLTDILKSQFGFKKLREDALEEGIVIDTKTALVEKDENDDGPVPPLSLKKSDKKKSGRKSFTTIRMTRSAGVRSPRTPKVSRARSAMKSKVEERSPRATSAFSPRSISINSPSPRPSTPLQSSCTPRMNENFEDSPHPKPSRYIVHKPQPNYPTIPEQMVMPTRMQRPPKSALRLPDEPRPDTGMTTGRKSVTIREDANITRPSTTATMFRPSTAGTSPFGHQRPSTDAKSAMDTIVAPYSARPKSGFSMISDRSLPHDITEAYRPASSIHRPMTPADFHPRPVLHADVTVKRAAGQTLFFPPTNISFNRNPPTEHPMKQMQPPPFVNRVNPQNAGRRPKRVRLDAGDGSNELSGTGSFFLTELPEELRTSRASILSRGSRFKKPSPPPDYSMSSTDKIIETSSQFGE